MTETQTATIKATIGALRYAAQIAFGHSEDLARDLYDTARDVEVSSLEGIGMCCPVCQEVRCDEGCPLEDLRAAL